MMTEQSSGQDRPDEWGRSGYFPGEQYAGEQYFGAGGSGSAKPGGSGYAASAQGGSGYGSSGQGGSGYGGSSLGGSGYGSGQGAARLPNSGLAGQGTTGSGAAGPGLPTAPVWQAAPGQSGVGQAMPDPKSTPPAGISSVGMSQAADARGFLSALFDFSFTSFVTTRIIKVLYVLILILAVLSALIYTIVAFRISGTFGFLTLIIGDPLFILIVMAFWRLVLESFVVRFRIAEDVRAMRERGGR
jgi:hypothetical protein